MLRRNKLDRDDFGDFISPLDAFRGRSKTSRQKSLLNLKEASLNNQSDSMLFKNQIMLDKKKQTQENLLKDNSLEKNEFKSIASI